MTMTIPAMDPTDVTESFWRQCIVTIHAYNPITPALQTQMNTPILTPPEERLEQLSRELAGTRRWSRWTSNLALFIGLIAFALMCGYFGYFYYLLNDLTRPESAVRVLSGIVAEQGPELRKMASEEIRESAPVVAREISARFIERLPIAREQLEATINRAVDAQLSEAHQRTSEEFERIIRENRDEFRDAIKGMVDESDSQTFVDNTMPIFEKEYIPGLRYDAIRVLGVLDDLDQKFERLATSETLNPVEAQMRHILGLTRYLREKEVPGTIDTGQ